MWICNIRSQITILRDPNYLAMLMHVDELAYQCYVDIGKALHAAKRSYHEVLELRMHSNVSLSEYEQEIRSLAKKFSFVNHLS